jgi:hypothetical protein
MCAMHIGVQLSESHNLPPCIGCSRGGNKRIPSNHIRQINVIVPKSVDTRFDVCVRCGHFGDGVRVLVNSNGYLQYVVECVVDPYVKFR